jgi:antitoxin HicB
MKFRVIVQQDEDGVFSAEAPSRPGYISQGQTRAEALDNIGEAIEGYLAANRFRRRLMKKSWMLRF